MMVMVRWRSGLAIRLLPVQVQLKVARQWVLRLSLRTRFLLGRCWR